MVSKLTDEKAAAIQQNQKLREELVGFHLILLLFAFRYFLDLIYLSKRFSMFKSLELYKHHLRTNMLL